LAIQVKRLFAAARRAALGLLALLPFATLADIQPASAEPAMWVVKDADTTIYLFGTVHILKPEINWRSDRIDAAFRSSENIWMELAEDAPTAVSQAQIWRYGKDPAHPLSTKLSPEERQRLRAAAVRAGIAPVSLESLRPWLAAIVLSMAPMEQAGYQSKFGIENQLRVTARAANKTIKGLETIDQQFGFLAGLPPELELAMLAQIVEMQMEGVDQLDRMVGAWLAGDVDQLAELMTGDSEVLADNVIYKRLLVDRNQQWAKQISDMMTEPGSHFIAVGAAHLAGTDSVQALLAKRGLNVARY
jgi:uncharacterized protein YbaP (TraB family)